MNVLSRLPPEPYIVDAVIAYALSSEPNFVTKPIAAKLLLTIGGPSTAPALVALLDVVATSAQADAIVDRLGELDDPSVADALEKFVAAFRAQWGKQGKPLADRAKPILAALRRPR